MGLFFIHVKPMQEQHDLDLQLAVTSDSLNATSRATFPVLENVGEWPRSNFLQMFVI